MIFHSITVFHTNASLVSIRDQLHLNVSVEKNCRVILDIQTFKFNNIYWKKQVLIFRGRQKFINPLYL